MFQEPTMTTESDTTTAAETTTTESTATLQEEGTTTPLHPLFSLTLYIAPLFCDSLVVIASSITVWTVHTVLTAISQSNGNGQILTTYRIQTPKPITIKLCTIDYVHETNT